MVLAQSPDQLWRDHAVPGQPRSLPEKAGDPMGFVDDGDLGVGVDHPLQHGRSRPRATDDKDVGVPVGHGVTQGSDPPCGVDAAKNPPGGS